MDRTTEPNESRDRRENQLLAHNEHLQSMQTSLVVPIYDIRHTSGRLGPWQPVSM
jgi:hypothetical protein